MKLNIWYVSISLLMTLFLGCNSSSNQKMPDQKNQILITSDNFNRIVGMQWILQKMTVDGSDYPLVREVPYVKFETDGKLNGFASINRFFGSMQIDEQGKIKWSDAFGSTKMAGPENLMRQEDVFLQSLVKTHKLAVEGIHLYAYSEDRQVELVFYVPVK